MPKLTVNTESDLKVGSQDKNFVSLEIEATETMELFASIDLPRELCGDPQTVQLNFQSVPIDRIGGSATRADAKLIWEGGDAFLLDEKVTIRITGFNPESSCDKAGLHLKIWDDPDATALYEKDIPVSVSAARGVAIISFDVSPTNIVRGDEVKISSFTTGADTVTLFANDIKQPDPESRQEPGGRRNTWVLHPQDETMTYRLEAWRDKSGGSRDDGQFAQDKVLVRVEPRPMWYTRDLITNSLRGPRVGQRFYPTLLLAAKDLSGKVGDRLYGIFVCNGTKYAELWSSSSGFDGWRWEADVPDGMGESPGVIHNQALWLIGGSSADPLGPASNRVWWYYYSEGDKKMVWKEWDPGGAERKNLAKDGKAPAPLKCHACAVFGTPEKVWVLGGLSELDTTLADVWSCSADPKGGDFTPSWERCAPLPSARCMSASATTPKSPNIQGVSESTLWLYGGATHPYNRYETVDELLCIADGKTWEGKDLNVPMKLAQAATLLYDPGDKLLHLVGISEEGTFDHALRNVTSEPTGWDKGSLTKFGWDYKTELFLMRSVCFRKRWIFWPVYQSWDGKEKCDARIYNTP
jgi:hypothetical protein